ncbi:MAG TPA: type IV secretory system conjugative DNA transfer family protein [Candidatus Gallacutalibacter pullicola]|uniref:Type IV secretory system conjugative DNA transfer family protein n=1 Tax=Candidatus Gallacutalibacter pullicola TaxID=2840830 RepID=A0A9D1J1W2_9FIRM|nr:type IV secretory system conjugative DNA transfer family protein [Candidatus Gallacutalibacter pullicola]
MWLLPLPVIWWTALLTAGSWIPGKALFEQLSELAAAMNHPFSLCWTGNSVRFLLLFSLIYAAAAVAAVSSRKNFRRGEEYGSAQWGDVFRIVKRYQDQKHPTQNLILTQHFQMGLDGHKHKRNTNVLVIGGSGAGKSRSYAIPNALNCGDCSLVICDPKAGATRS